MKNCTDCKHAKWNTTESGRLHPSGDGFCQYPYRVPPLPASMRWSLWTIDPIPNGGHINRREELGTHCVYFSKKP